MSGQLTEWLLKNPTFLGRKYHEVLRAATYDGIPDFTQDTFFRARKKAGGAKGKHDLRLVIDMKLKTAVITDGETKTVVSLETLKYLTAERLINVYYRWGWRAVSTNRTRGGELKKTVMRKVARK